VPGEPPGGPWAGFDAPAGPGPVTFQAELDGSFTRPWYDRRGERPRWPLLGERRARCNVIGSDPRGGWRSARWGVAFLNGEDEDCDRVAR
jgi:hypothetical protein